ncbi:unnamed protein product [Rotaria sp. Silwood2]|nr:unnamed protein product [Rotaria sp. Silwood2]CAF2872964.1 unnamed protein product [Rotaria sp. Silwood2]CAF3025267.1 unnamed protein product [Rotaria sp. Silwood2]CAF4088776.1 unnamed protein product [Rotaria sp. Silwood2]CAF4156646.1 unnamed protein product [Rotaria sp. Silwood2]
MFLFSNSDAKRGRGGGLRAGSYGGSSSSSSSDSSSNGGGTAVGFLLMLLCCGAGIGGRIYRCYRNEERRKRTEEQVHRICTNLSEVSRMQQLHERNLSNMTGYIVVHVPIGSFQEVSEKQIEKNETEQPEIQSSNDLQQPNSEEEKCSMIVPVKDNDTSPSRTN